MEINESENSRHSPTHPALAKRVVLVDDDPTIRELTRMLLNSVGVELLAYENPQHYLDELPDAGCVLLDVLMPDMSGLELFRRMRDLGVQAPVIFLTGHGELSMAVEAMRDGAFHFLEKPANDQKLIDAVYAALAADKKRRDATQIKAQLGQLMARLTNRERGIAELLADGLLSREIADKLGLSVRTVEGYRGNIYRKLEADSLAEIIKIVKGAQGLLPAAARGKPAVSPQGSSL